MMISEGKRSDPLNLFFRRSGHSSDWQLTNYRSIQMSSRPVSDSPSYHDYWQAAGATTVFDNPPPDVALRQTKQTAQGFRAPEESAVYTEPRVHNSPPLQPYLPYITGSIEGPLLQVSPNLILGPEWMIL